MNFIVNQLAYKMLIHEDNYNQRRQFLILKAEIYIQSEGIKRNQFKANINCTEYVFDNQCKKNFTESYTVQGLIPKSLKEKKDDKNNVYILKWQIPINEYLIQINESQTKKSSQQIILDIETQQELKLQYFDIEGDKLQSKSYVLSFNKVYDFNTQQYNKLMDLFSYNETGFLEKKIQHQLILQRSNKNKIPITLKMKQNVFNQIEEKQIEITLQGQFQRDLLPQVVEFTLYQEFVYRQKEKTYQILTQTQKESFQKNENESNNNYEVNAIIDLNPIENILPLYLGQNFQIHHLIQIKIIFVKTNCCDFSQRIFDIFVPIEIIANKMNQNQNQNQNQIQIQIQNQNQNQNQYNQKNYTLLQQNENFIKLDFCPQFCEQYQNYQKVVVLDEQKLIIRN